MNNSRSFIAIVAVVLALLFSVVITVTVMTDPRNALSAFAGYMAVGIFLWGFLFGARALWVLPLIIAFGDLLKRALILYGYLSYNDIGKVLVFAPLLLGGISASLLLSWIRGKIKFSRFDWIVFWVCAVFTAVSSVWNLFHYNHMMAVLKNIALGSSFFMLPWVVLVSLRTPEDIMKFIKFFLIVFFFVALFGIKQGVFGLSDFYMDYYESGFTIEGRQLKNDVIRIPSTMNAARSLSITMAMCLMLFISYRMMRGRGLRGLIHPLTFICVPAFFVTMVLTLTRAGWVAFLVFPICLVCFGSKIRTGILYFTGAVSLFLLVAFAEKILENWVEINSKVGAFVGADSAFEKQATNIATFSARLVGWRNLTSEPALWSAFGVEATELENMEAIDLHTGTRLDNKSSGLVHDSLTKAVVKFGLVPVFFALILGIFVLRWLHSLPFKIRDPDERRMTVLLLACLVSVAISGVTSVMHVPVNALLFILVGMMLSMAVRTRAREAVRGEEPEGVGGAGQIGMGPGQRNVPGHAVGSGGPVVV